MSKYIISANNIDVGYGKRVVVENVVLEALKGQVVCLLGPNGAGKSTILRTLSGILAPVNGAVYIDGNDIRKAKKKEIARKLSLVLTDSVSPALTTVYELMAMGRTPYTNFMGKLTEEDKRIIYDSLETVGAMKLKDRFYSQLSDGEKQKVMIARALVQEPEMIILDEPTSHLDIKHKVEVVKVLQKLSNERGITCILSLHDIDLALKGCQTVLLVNDGKVMAQGTPEEVIYGGIIQELYDIHDARYSELLGAVELTGKMSNDVFVVGGNSTGVNLYRALSRRGYGITTGVLHENDGDYLVARGICSEIVSEAPFEKISGDTVAKAESLMSRTGAVIDSGFPVGTANADNMKILNRAIDMGKNVYSMRSESECRQLYRDNADRVCSVHGVNSLLKALSEQR